MVGVVDEDGGINSSNNNNTAAAISAALDGSTAYRRKYRIDQAMRLPRPGMDVRPPLDMGLVEDFDMLEAVWRHGYLSLRANPSDHPVMLSDPTFSQTAQKEKQAEILFESLGVPCLYFGKSPVLQAFSMGRSSALVVDIGASASRVTPVVDGYCLNRGQLLSEIGGQAITAALSDIIAKSGQLPDRTIWPRSLIKRNLRSSGNTNSSTNDAIMDTTDTRSSSSTTLSSSSSSSDAQSSVRASSTGITTSTVNTNTRYVGPWEVTKRPNVEYTSSYHAVMVAEVIDDAKKVLCEVAEIGYDEKRPPSDKTYELPDGTVITVGSSRQIVSELHFRHETMEQFQNLLKSRVSTAWHAHNAALALMRATVPLRNSAGEPTGASTQLPLTLPGMIQVSLGQCHAEVRRDLCNHILVTGGASLLNGLTTRLKWETMALIPAAFKPRLLVPSTMERSYGAWIGGSILSSLGTMHQLWISKQEWEEEGGSIIERRCPN